MTGLRFSTASQVYRGIKIRYQQFVGKKFELMLRMAYVALVNDHVLGSLETFSLDRYVTEDESFVISISYMS